MRPRILPGYPALLLPAALLAALLIFISKVSIVREYGNNTPFWDQWDAEAEQLYKPYKQGRLGLSSILRTHNEHRITTTRILHLGLFVLTGCKWTPKLQMHVNALLHVSAISLFLAFTCWAVPTRARLPVWIAGTLLFLVPFGWDNVLQGFNTHFYTLLFFSVALLWTCCIARSLLPSAAIAILLAISCVLTMASGALVLVAACVILGFRVLLFGETRVPAVLVVVFSVIAATSVIYTPRLEHHEHLRSASMGQFFGAMVQAYAWPLDTEGLSTFVTLVLAMLIHAPLVVALSWYLLMRRNKRKPILFLVAIAAWFAMQVVPLAYGRATEVTASRYQDALAFGVVANLTATIIIWLQFPRGFRWFAACLSASWLTLICYGVASQARDIPAKIQERATLSRIQERNVQGYLSSGDVKWLRAAKFQEIPYPSADRLRKFLDDCTIREFLPAHLLP